MHVIGASHVFYSDHLHAQIMTRQRTETELRQALEDGDFRSIYQPIVVLDVFRDARTLAAPQRSLVSPEDFIPVAEATRLIMPLGAWMLREACRQFSRTGRLELKVNVNLSSKQLMQRPSPKLVEGILADTGLEPRRSKLEINESAVVENKVLARRYLTQLGHMGVHVLMDDFGTDYSSLSYLHSLPTQTLKIDKSFVSQLQNDPKSLGVVRTISTLTCGLELCGATLYMFQAVPWAFARSLSPTATLGRFLWKR